MAGDVSFDVVSDFDEQELRNALDQVRREVQQRFDFKGATVELDPGQGGDHAPHRRRVPCQGDQGPDRIQGGPAQPLAQDLRLGHRRTGGRQQGPPADRAAPRAARGLAKRITKLIRDEFPKVKSQIQGDAVRVSGKSKDDLQRVITRLRELDEAVPLQFENYR